MPGTEDRSMRYEYTGYLKTLLYKPDPALMGEPAAALFSAEVIAKWTTREANASPEWNKVPARRQLIDDVVRFEAHFQDVRGIDLLPPDDPRYWAPLGTIGMKDSLLPLNITSCPIIELTYRCVTPNVHPAILWTYPGGNNLISLPQSEKWITVVRKVSHFGSPEEITDIVLRLRSTSRTSEKMEVKQIRFRAMSPSEEEACRKDAARLNALPAPPKYPVLDEVLPIGIYMDAALSNRLASMLEISLEDYWRLVLEDMVKHNHNAISLSRVQDMDSSDFRLLLKLAEDFRVHLVLRGHLPDCKDKQALQRFIDEDIRPNVTAPAILAWTLSGTPTESGFGDVMTVKAAIEAVDPNHPVGVIAPTPNAYALYAPFFSVSGLGHFDSLRSWDLGPKIATHLPLGNAQQFWVAAPAFTTTTNTPFWSRCPDMRMMTNLAVANGARGWFSFCYHNDPLWIHGRCQRSLTGPFLTFSDLWSELGRRMTTASAMAPLLLQAEPAAPEPWLKVEAVTHDRTGLPDDIDPVGVYRMEGPDFALYYVISHNVKDMVSVNLSMPSKHPNGRVTYDLNDFIFDHRWRPAGEQRHLEMFPGQENIFLIAEPKGAERYRKLIVDRLIDIYQREMFFNFHIAQVHHLDYNEVDILLRQAEDEGDLQGLQSIYRARQILLDLIYSSPSISVTRCKIIEASAAICGCDGVLCRMFTRGKSELAHELGVEQLVPITQECTRLRLELRKGRGVEIQGECETVARRAIELLIQLREAASKK